MANASSNVARKIIEYIFSYDYHDEEVNSRIRELQDCVYSHSKIIQACCNSILDFTKVKNNVEYIHASLDKLI